MSSHLTDAERETLNVAAALFGWATTEEAQANLYPAVETLIAARVAAEREQWVSIINDPYAETVWIQGHSHAEPICAWPDCREYLTLDEMAHERLIARADRDDTEVAP